MLTMNSSPTAFPAPRFFAAVGLLSLLVVGLTACDDAPSPGDDTSAADATSGDSANHDSHGHDSVATATSCNMAPAVIERPLAADDAPSDGLILEGQILNSAGQPAEGVFVLACTGSLCLNGKTDATGNYSFTTQVRTEKHKMQVNGFIKGYMSFNFYQDPQTEPSLSAAVIAPDHPGAAAPLPKETGGTVTLAGGELVITAPAGIKYDIGEPNELTAVRVAQTELPPYDFDLTACSQEPLVAYMVNPLKTKLTEGTFEVTAKLGATAGTKYGIWVVDSNTAEVHKEATATADANGDVVKDAGTELHHLDMLIFVPE